MPNQDNYIGLDKTTTEVLVPTILYQDCSSPGEVADVHRESDACYYCALSPVCLVAHAKRVLDDAFVAVSRCRAFVDRVVEGEEFVLCSSNDDAETE